MPDTDGGLQYELQCLNDPGGIQDMTFVDRDVPEAIARIARVQPPGRAWGVAGYSEGGYCAANIAVQDPAGYGAAGVMSGYFAPIPSRVPAGGKPGGKPRLVNVFAGRPALEQLNSPRWYITRASINAEIPAFWLAAGAKDRPDVEAAMNFRQLLLTRVANVPLDVIPDGGHQGSVWRAALDPMLKWMTPQLAQQAAKADLAAARAAAAQKAAEARKKAQQAKPKPVRTVVGPKKQ
jgi:S-formylglutathione hydrolase FrmB